MSELPPYSADPPSTEEIPSAQVTYNRIAGDRHTISIADHQHDYFKLVRASPTSFTISLTVDPTPIYRIEFSLDSSDVGDIAVFPAFSDSKLLVASIRFIKNPKKNEAIATICMASPHLPSTRSLSLFKASSLAYGQDYRSSIPIIAVPGMSPTLKTFVWRTTISAPYFELWLDGPLPNQSQNQHQLRDAAWDNKYLFATCNPPGPGQRHDNIIMVRRGGGLEFELAVILEMIAILHSMNRRLL